MALEENNGFSVSMPVQPMNGGGGWGYPVAYPAYYGGNNNGGGMFGGDWGALIILFLFAAMFGGFGGMGGFGMGGFGMGGGYGTFPWILNGQNDINNNVSDGFRDVQLNDNITSVRDGVNNVSTQLCNGFAGVNATVNSAQHAISQQLYTNQLADLERSFAAQTASTQGMNAIQAQLAQCCCDNRLGTETLRATVLQENCQDRYEAANNTRDIIQSQTSGTQAILDKLCALELDAKNTKIADLERQLTMANLAASQTAQTARLERSNNEVIDGLYNRLATCPVGTMPVYGNQPIFTCPQNNSPCGCNGGF